MHAFLAAVERYRRAAFIMLMSSNFDRRLAIATDKETTVVFGHWAYSTDTGRNPRWRSAKVDWWAIAIRASCHTDNFPSRAINPTERYHLGQIRLSGQLLVALGACENKMLLILGGSGCRMPGFSKL
jgi:hypothetical protein